MLEAVYSAFISHPSGGSTSSKINAIVMYVLGTSSDGVWAWGLVRSEERQLPEDSLVPLSHRSESTGKWESQTQSGTFANPKVAILQQLTQLHSLKYSFIQLELISYN